MQAQSSVAMTKDEARDYAYALLDADPVSADSFKEIAEMFSYRGPLTTDDSFDLLVRYINHPNADKDAFEYLRTSAYMHEKGAMRLVHNHEIPLPESFLVWVMTVFRHLPIKDMHNMLKHPSAGTRVVDKAAGNYRLSVARVAAAHPALSTKKADGLSTHLDWRIRKAVASGDSVSEGPLRVLACDHHPAVAKAAEKSLLRRGLPLHDEITAALDDEVSVFFLSAAADDETARRLGSSDLPDEILEQVAFTSRAGFRAVAQNRRTGAAVLDRMLHKALGNSEWRAEVVMVAVHPNASKNTVMTALEAQSYQRDIILAAIRGPYRNAEVVNEYGKRYSAVVRIAAAESGLLYEETVEAIMKYESRRTVLAAFAACAETPDHILLRLSHKSDSRISDPAKAQLVARGYMLNEATK